MSNKKIKKILNSFEMTDREIQEKILENSEATAILLMVITSIIVVTFLMMLIKIG